MSGYMEGFKEDSKEFFYPESFLTKDEFAKIIFKMGDFKSKDEHIEIADLNQCKNAKIIQILVDNSILSVEGENFNPDSFITYNEIINAFNKF
jgi:iron complex transport system substrate-binding protein